MLKQEEQEKKILLRKDKEYVKFTQLLRRAEREGRLDGTFTCNLCGMKYHSTEESNGCCKVPVT